MLVEVCSVPAATDSACVAISMRGTSAAPATSGRQTQTSGSSGEAVVLNATGYIIAAHKIQVASKVVGKVAWIGVEVVRDAKSPGSASGM